MKDYLEPEVEEKYYIKSEKAQQLIEELKSSGQLERAFKGKPGMEESNMYIPKQSIDETDFVDTIPERERERERERESRPALTAQSISQRQETPQTALRQDMMPESQIYAQMEHLLLTAKLNYTRIETVGNSCAKTLMARDYKGFGTGFDTQNGVIEKNE